MTWFTSDSHFGHANIVKYTGRPFDNVYEMDAALIKNWNAVVAPVDEVYHLGDFTLGGVEPAKRYFSQLNGRIRVLGYPWHHDARWLPDDPGDSNEFYSAIGHPVKILPPVHVLSFEEYGTDTHPQYIVLSHYPFAVWDRKHYGAWHLHGHSHGKHDADGFMMDVGVDTWNGIMRPISLSEVANEMIDYGWYPGWSQYGDKNGKG